MGIRRTELSFDEKFTQIPNDWARDAKLTRRARGLLVEIMSHSVGWHVTIRSLAKGGKEGRDAIQTALNELLEHGYVRRTQGRAPAGKFAEIEYELCEPQAASGFSGHGTVSGFAASGSTVSGESDPKEEHKEEDHLSEDQGLFPSTGLDEPPTPVATFAEFYMAYPRKVGKEDARRAFEKVTKTIAAEVVVAGARRYAADPNLPDKKFIPYPASWLRDGRWDDEPEVAGAHAASADGDEFAAQRDAWLRRHGLTYAEYLDHVDEPGWLESIERRVSS